MNMSEPPPLDYRNPADEADERRIVTQAVAGALLSCLALLGAVFVGILAMVARSTEYDPISWLILIGVVGGTLVGLVAASVRMLRLPRQRGWSIGIWIGIGLAGLVEGACFTFLF